MAHVRRHQHIQTHFGSIQGIPSSFRQVSDDDKAFAIVNDPAGFYAMRAICEVDDFIVFNLGFEPLKLPNGTVVSPAGSIVIEK